MFDWVIAPQSATTLYIYRWGGLAPAGVEGLTNLVLKYNSNSVYKSQTRSNRLDPRSNRPGDVEIFRKPYLSHPDSKLDVRYMNLDLLDETYPIGKSKLPFKDFVQGGLTGVEGGLTGLAQTCYFWVSTIRHR
jgi:hypothetical protein